LGLIKVVSLDDPGGLGQIARADAAVGVGRGVGGLARDQCDWDVLDQPELEPLRLPQVGYVIHASQPIGVLFARRLVAVLNEPGVFVRHADDPLGREVVGLWGRGAHSTTTCALTGTAWLNVIVVSFVRV